MKSLILLGEEESKRTSYFIKAVKSQGQSVELLPLFSLCPQYIAGRTVKIDPVMYTTDDLRSLRPTVEKYLDQLRKLRDIPANYLNHPQGIIDSLDKRKSKELLFATGVPVTPLLPMTDATVDCLLDSMEIFRPFGVFIKPNLGSGAAGIVAYRRQHSTGRGVAYTTLSPYQNTYRNTQKIHRISDDKALENLLTFALHHDSIVEEWLPKAKVGSLSYDFRVVVQFGQVAYILARSSKGVITNLHLNNRPLFCEDLCLPPPVLERVQQVAVQATLAFPLLQVAGVDVLLTPSHSPYVIEINSQGDLIHQDIYSKNSIYTMQAKGLITHDE